MFKKIAQVGFATLFSRILGYFRDMLIAFHLGCGLYADAFFVAFKIPNLLRQLLGEGALSSSFIPVLSGQLKTESREKAARTASYTFYLLLMLTASLVILGEIFTPAIVRIMAPGFAVNPQKFLLTVKLTRIMMPILSFISLAALATGMSNSLKYFFIPSAAPALMNVSVILFFMSGGSAVSLPVKGLSLAVLSGIFLEMLLPFYGPLKEKLLNLRLIETPGRMLEEEGVHRMLLLFLPATLGSAVYQINSFVDTICASFLEEGSVSALYYSLRLTHLPMALFSISVITVFFPYLAESFAAKKEEEFRARIERSLSYNFLFILPATAGLYLLAPDIISLLFGRGRFTAEAVYMTSGVLRFYTLGLIFYSGAKTLSSVFYSLQDTRTPVKIAVGALVINIILNLILMVPLRARGLALATAIASAVNCIYLSRALYKKTGYLFSRNLLRKLSYSVIASLLLSSFLIFFPFETGSQILRFLMKITGSVLIYFAAVFLLFKLDKRTGGLFSVRD